MLKIPKKVVKKPIHIWIPCCVRKYFFRIWIRGSSIMHYGSRSGRPINYGSTGSGSTTLIEMRVRHPTFILEFPTTKYTAYQGCGSVLIWPGSGSGPNILGWIPIRIRIQYGSNFLMTKNREHTALQNMKFLDFLYFLRPFLSSWMRIRIPNPDPLARLNPDPMRIRIRTTLVHTVQLYGMVNWW